MSITLPNETIPQVSAKTVTPVIRSRRITIYAEQGTVPVIEVLREKIALEGGAKVPDYAGEEEHILRFTVSTLISELPQYTTLVSDIATALDLLDGRLDHLPTA